LRGNKWVPCRSRVSCYVVWSRKLKIPLTQSDHPPPHPNSSAAPFEIFTKKREIRSQRKVDKKKKLNLSL
jgi:hypothetical protein